VTTQNNPRDERHQQRRIADLERRIKALETAPRAAKTSFSNGRLTVGDPASTSRIEVDGNERRIRFWTADGPTDLIAGGGQGGAMLTTASNAGSVFPFSTEAYVWNGAYFSSIHVSRVAGTSATTQAEIYADVQDSGGGNSRGTVTLSATGVGDADGSLINLFSDGGVVLSSNDRATDPPAPPAGCVVLYAKGTPARLYYRDPAGAVHGPL
jgi:hypothetical protein